MSLKSVGSLTNKQLLSLKQEILQQLNLYELSYNEKLELLIAMQQERLNMINTELKLRGLK